MREEDVQQLADHLMGSIFDQAAHWEVTFPDGPPGEVVSVSDAAHVAARAVLASGLVVPTSDVLNLAQQWDVPFRYPFAQERNGRVCAAELRALTRQKP